MYIFDKIGKTANKTYKYTADKTTKFAREANLRMKIAKNRAIIEDTYEDIGKKVYEKHIREEEINIKTELEEECLKIDFLADEIKDSREEILLLKCKKQCEKCALEIDIDYGYCPSCGHKQNNEPSREEQILENLESSDIHEEKEEEAKIVANFIENQKEEVQEEQKKENDEFEETYELELEEDKAEDDDDLEEDDNEYLDD